MLFWKFPIPTSTLLPYPLTPTSWPWQSPILGHIKFAIPRGLSFQWWQTRPSSATYAARNTSSGGVLVMYLHFKCYCLSRFPLQETPIPFPLFLPLWGCSPSHPPIHNSLPWHSPVLGHIKLAIPKGLSSQWWPTWPSSATYAARDTRSGGTG